MSLIRSYALTVICASMLCGLITDIAKNTTFQKQLRMLCGVFLITAILKPLLHLNADRFMAPFQTISADGQTFADTGKNISDSALADIIRQETEAYIIAEAKRLDTEIIAEVILDQNNPPIPIAVRLYGSVSADKRKQISDILETELKIQQENQLWIEPT